MIISLDDSQQAYGAAGSAASSVVSASVSAGGVVVSVPAGGVVSVAVSSLQPTVPTVKQSPRSRNAIRLMRETSCFKGMEAPPEKRRQGDSWLFLSRPGCTDRGPCVQLARPWTSSTGAAYGDQLKMTA